MKRIWARINMSFSLENSLSQAEPFSGIDQIRYDLNGARKLILPSNFFCKQQLTTLSFRTGVCRRGRIFIQGRYLILSLNGRNKI